MKSLPGIRINCFEVRFPMLKKIPQLQVDSFEFFRICKHFSTVMVYPEYRCIIVFILLRGGQIWEFITSHLPDARELLPAYDKCDPGRSSLRR